MTIVYYTPQCSIPVSYPKKQYINNGITNSKFGMPQKFKGADGGASFSIGRNVFIKTASLNNTNNLISLIEDYKNNKNNSGKYIPVQNADSYIQRKKNIAIGKGSLPTKNKYNDSYDLSFKQNNSQIIQNEAYNARRKCRNSGSVPPPKINSIYRPSCN